MPRLLLAIATAASLAVTGAANAAQLPFKITTDTLDNGLRVVMVPTASPGLIAYFEVVRAGSRDEVEKGVTGFAHFFEHMMFRGTKAYPPERVAEYVKRTGADQNGFTTDDFTCYTFFGRNDWLEELVQMEADRFQNLEYSVDAFRTESQAILGEYRKGASDPVEQLEEKLREAVFHRHTYGHTTIGYLADVEGMPNQYAYSRVFFQRFYTPDDLTIIVVGDFVPEKLQALVRQYYGRWKGKRATPTVKPEPPQRQEIRRLLPWDAPMLPILSLSWRIPATRYDSADAGASEVLFELLFGKISRLYGDLVLEKQVVEDFQPLGGPHRDPYLFHVLARVKDAKEIPGVEKRIEAEVEALARGKVDAAALEDVKANVRYQTLLELQTPEHIAGALAFSMAPTGEVDGLEKELAAVARVTPNDVQRFAARYLKRMNRSVVVLKTKEAAK